MPEIVVALLHSTPEEILAAVERGEIKAFLHDRQARFIRWKRSAGNILTGRIPYVRSKNLCLHEFSLQPISHQSIRVEARAIPLAYLLMALSGVIGLLMCCVGIVFPIIILVAVNGRIEQIRRDLQQAIEAWDRARASIDASTGASG